ncbi:MAG: carboxypeptidase regulatory-like domain-containing protein [Candidatus Zixiibacteriota bacterium]
MLSPRIRKIMFALAVVAAMVSSASARPVKGVVKNSITGVPLANVVVKILQTGDSTQTNGSGVYLFADVPDGLYTFMTGEPNYVPNIKTSVRVALGCCAGTTGNVDGDPGDVVDIGDLSLMVDFLFFGGTISTCFAENDVDLSSSVDISDLQVLIDFLFFGSGIPSCPL